MCFGGSSGRAVWLFIYGGGLCFFHGICIFVFSFKIIKRVVVAEVVGLIRHRSRDARYLRKWGQSNPSEPIHHVPIPCTYYLFVFFPSHSLSSVFG